MTFSHPIVELRQYTLHPGKRDTLVELFDREFVTGQEAAGIAVIGQFRDLDRPDRFVWLRGFPDMESRAQSLATFYSGPDWKAHSKVANSTMIDSENVLLLHPANVKVKDAPDHASKGDASDGGILLVTIVALATPAREGFSVAFEQLIRPALADSGIKVIACYETDESPNTFPALPVREGEQVFVWLSSFGGSAAADAHLADRAHSERWQADVSPIFTRWAKGTPEVLRLAPTPGSRFQI